MIDLDNNTKTEKEIGKTIATKIPTNTYHELIYLVEHGSFLSLSDFLREAIREHIKRYKIANFREIDYEDAKREIISYFIKYPVCFLDEIAIDLEFEFELVNIILKDLMVEGRVKLISKEDDEFKKRMDEENKNIKKEKHFVNDGNNFIKFKGKRIVVEAKGKETEFISLRRKSKNANVLRNHGVVLNNGTIILSDCYMFVG